MCAHAAAPDALRARVEALADLSERATAGEWWLNADEGGVSDVLGETTSTSATIVCTADDTDAALIVAAVNLVRALLEETQ